MSSQKVLSVRATRVLACAGLLSYDEILSPDDNTLILEVIRNANLQHLLGNPNSEKERSEVCDWLSQSQTLSETDLPKIETSLYMKSYLVGYTFTIADAAIYEAIRDKCVSSVSKFPELSRWFDHMQHTCLSAGFETMKFGSPASHFMCLPVSHAAPIRAKKEVVPAVATAKATVIPSTTSTIDKSAEVTSPEVTSEAPEANTNKEKKERKEKKEKKTDAVAETAKGAEVAAVAGDAGDELDPSKLDIRVGIVVKCWNHPDSEKLLCEEIDVGESVVRTIASGIRPHYAAEDLVNRKVCVLANLKDRNLAGFKSQGMVLCAVSADHTHIKLLEAPHTASAGDRITFPGFTGEAASSAQMAKKKILEKLAPQLRTDSAGVAHWFNSPFTVDTGVCVAHELLADAVVS